MITKEDSYKLYNYHSQIETTEKLIEELQDAVDECDGNCPDIIEENYRKYGSIQICIPTFGAGKFTGSATVYNIRYDAAIKVLKEHVEHLKRKLEELSDKIEKSNSYATEENLS